MNSRILVKTGVQSLAALAVAAVLQMTSSALADGQPVQNHRTNSAAFGILTTVPLQCNIGGSGDVAKGVHVRNQTQATIPAGKLVSWTVKNEGTGAKEMRSATLNQPLAPQKSATVGSTVMISNSFCTASVKL